MKPSLERSKPTPGLLEQTEAVEPSVLQRRKLHEAAAKWCAKWLTSLQVVFAFIGFTVVLLPVLSKTWRSIIEHIAPLSTIFHDYSTFSGWSLVHLFVGMSTAIAKTLWMRNSSKLSMHSYKEIVNREYYPKTIREEVAFWLDVVGTVMVTTVWLFLPFSVLAYFITTGS